MKKNIIQRTLTAVLTIVALAVGQSAWAIGTFTVTNTEGTSKFVITRTSNTSTTETVYYRTVSLSAIAGQHFADKYGELTFDADHNSREVEVTESTPSSDVYKYQTSTSRKYRFEVLDPGGFQLASCDRTISNGITKFNNTYLNKSITNLVYFDGNGKFKSGSGNKFMDVNFSMPSGYADGTDSYAGFALIDDSYNYGQKPATVSTNSLITSTGASSDYLNTLKYKIYATVCFTMKEKNDGYYYVQILKGTSSSSYDGYDSNGVIDNGPSNSIYKACFELKEGSGIYNYEGKAFFPHRYDYANPTAENKANIGITEFYPLTNNTQEGKLWQQKFKTNTPSYRANNSGSLVLDPTVANITTRFDCAGEDNDTWGYKDFFVRMALVDETAPTASGSKKVNSGRHSKGNTIYVSVPFSEIVTVSGTPTLNTTWGTLSYIAGSGSNVLTFEGTISTTASGDLTISGYSGTITDLAGNSLSGTISGTLLNSSYLEADYAYPITYNDLADGTLATANPNSYTYSTSTFVLNNPTRTGYDFAGWTGSNGTTPETTVGIATRSHGDKSYTANWTAHTYTLRLHHNDGTDGYTDQALTYNTVANIQSISRTGYTLDHWTTNADGSGTTYTEGQEVLNLTATDGEVIDLYAQWTANTYTVHFDANNGSGTMSNMAFTYDAAQNLTANAFTAPTGYHFVGWNTKADGSGDSYTDGQEVTNLTATDGATVDLYAQWTDVWGITNGADGTSEAKAYVITTTAGLDLLAKNVNGTDGYTANNFSGKYFKLGGDIEYHHNTTWNDATSTENNFTAIGNLNYSFKGTFDGDGHTISGIRIYQPNNGRQGLFGDITNGTVKNVTVSDARITGVSYVAGVAGETYNASTRIENCLVLNTCITAQSNGGVLVGYKYNGTYRHNFYRNCIVKVNGTTYTTNIGLGAPQDDYAGEVGSVHSLTLPANVTASGESIVIDGVTYYANKNTITLSCIPPDGYTLSGYNLNGTAFNGNTFTMPAADATVSATYTDCWGIADGADGSEAHPYIITTTTGLDLLATNVNSGINEYSGKYFKLGNDIDYQPTTTWDDATSTEDNYTAIGNNDHAFCGIFDGDEHTISGIRINKSRTDYQGLFGRVWDATVKNVTLTDARITGQWYVGGISGQTNGNPQPTIQDCLVFNTCITASTYCGAIVGRRLFGILNNNYYLNCSVTKNGTTGTTNIGVNSSDNNGARSVHALTLADGITASGESVEIGGTTYYASNTTVTLSSSVPEGYVVVYSYNDGSYHIIDGNTFTMPAADVTVSLAVPYIDADGNEQICTDFTLLESSTGSTVTLGTDGTESWYVVNGNVNITANNYVIEPFGAVHLILMDGATLTVQGSRPIDATGSLTIYGQSLGTGSLVATGSGTAIFVYNSNTGIVNDGTLTINGGNITATSTGNNGIVVKNAITINGGTVTASSGMFGYGITSTSGDITINGGSVNATGGDSVVGINASNSLTLGWRNTTDRIYASSYNGTKGIVIKSGQAFTDGTNIYVGTLTSGQVSAIAGKTLQPVDALVLADNADNTSIIDAHNGETVNVMLYGRTLYKDGKWNTLCLPFNIFVPTEIIQNEDSPLHGATIMTFDSSSWYKANGEKHSEHNEGDTDGCHRSGQIENGNLYLYFFKAMEGNKGYSTDISAGLPFLVKWDGDGTNNIVNPVFTGVTINNDTGWMNVTTDEGRTDSNTDGNVTFKSTYSPVTFDSENKSVLFMGGNNTLYYPEAGASIGAFRAYFQLNNGLSAGNLPANGVKMFFGNERPTLVSLPSEREAAGAWYDLQGRKVSLSPNPSPVGEGRKLPRGIYIHNGRKVVIK